MSETPSPSMADIINTREKLGQPIFPSILFATSFSDILRELVGSDNSVLLSLTVDMSLFCRLILRFRGSVFDAIDLPPTMPSVNLLV
jgi:hypothetical protein